MFYLIKTYLELEYPMKSLPIVEYVFNVGIVSLGVIFCFINVFGYLMSLYSIKTENVEEKYPKYKKIINYYKNSTLFFIILELILGFLGLIVIALLGFIPLFIA